MSKSSRTVRINEAELRGTVEYVNKASKNAQGKWNPKSFMVRTNAPGEPLMLCSCEGYCDPMPYDNIVARGTLETLNGKKVFAISKQPFLTPSDKRDGIVKIIEKVMEKVYWETPSNERTERMNPGMMLVRAEQLFDSLKRNLRLETDKAVSDCLDDDAEIYKEIISPIIGEKNKRLFGKFWYEVSVMRRLYAIGITKMDLKNYSGSKVQLYQDVFNNPYKVVFLSIEKCNQITRLKGEPLDAKMITAGTIIRYIHKRYQDAKHLFVTEKELENYIGADYKKSRQLLYDEFDVVFEDARILEGDLEIPDDFEYTLKSSLCRVKAGLPTTQEYRPNDRLYLPELRVSEDPPLDGDDERSSSELRTSDDGNINVYLNSNYQVELAISEYPLVMAKIPKLPPSEVVYTRSDLSEDQKEGVEYISQFRLALLTGGAGTGKTTLINELFHNNELLGRKTALVSYTGRAAAVLRGKVKGCKASTVHRYFSSKETPEHLIVDEASMLPADLFYKLLKEFPSIEQVTLVGDDNQLLPVGAGPFFHRYIESGRIPTYRLTQNHRVQNGDESGILVAAKKIASGNGRIVRLEDGKNFFIKDDEHGDITPMIDRFLEYNRRNKNKPITTKMFTIICPLREQVTQLNQLVQSKFRKGEYMYMGKKPTKIYVDDRIMMLVNDYDVNVFNGEEGYVTEIHPDEGYCVVDFTQPDGVPKFIRVIDDSDMEALVISDESINGEQHAPINEFMNPKGSKNDSIRCSAIEHSYANTPHKYQGSESDYVIVSLPNRDHPTSFMSKNLLYTAITRARLSLTVVGKKALINEMASYHPKYGNDNMDGRLALVGLEYSPEKKLKSEVVEEEDWEDDYFNDFEDDCDFDDY